MRNHQIPVMLSTPDADLGIVPIRGSRRKVKRAANETGRPVTVRNVVTDKVITTQKPDRIAPPNAAKRAAGAPFKSTNV